MNFSVLISIYQKENPLYFDKALASVFNQSLQPTEIVIVHDGLLVDGLYKVIQDYETKYPGIIRNVAYPENKGLGYALSVGLAECSFDIVARVDTDDICHFDRFQIQRTFLEENQKISIVGSFISEFEGVEDNIYAHRTLPLEHNEIAKFAKFRNPFNHMTVMLRKEDALKAGNYQTLIGFEDYYLWVRMLQNGCKFANLPYTLVNVRAGYDMISRRKGWKYITNEFRFQKILFKKHFISLPVFILNCVLRLIVRMFPSILIKYVYKIVRYL